MGCFYTDLYKGKVAEREFMKLLSTLSAEVIDVSNDKEYQEKDIDIIAKSQTNGNMISFEVKQQIQMYDSGNMLLETVSNKYINSLGWWRKCKADWLVFDVPQAKIFHIFHRETLEKVVDMYEFIGLIVEKENETNESRYYLMPLESAIKEVESFGKSEGRKMYFKVRYVEKEQKNNSLTLAS